MNWYKKSQMKRPDNWGGSVVYHGTDKQSAQDIIDNGIDNLKGSGGYFGWAFYTTLDKSMAQSNYADFAEEEEYTDTRGAVLTFKVSANAKVLDLAKPDHWDIYIKTNHQDFLNTPEGSQKIFTDHGIDAIFDDSNDSLMVFNTQILEPIDIERDDSIEEPKVDFEIDPEIEKEADRVNFYYGKDQEGR